MQVEAFLEQTADRLPDKVALICQGARFTYRQIAAQSRRLAITLRARGLRRGDRVAIFLDSSVEAVVAVFGALMADAVFVMIHAATKPDKLAFLLNDCRAAALIAHGRFGHLGAQAAALPPTLRQVIWVGAGAAPSGASSTLAMRWEEAIAPSLEGAAFTKEAIDIDLATIIYTSGSTGFPKGVMMTHLSVVTAATSITQYLENVEDDIILNSLPLSFDYGLYQVLMAFKVGATLVLEKSFTYPQLILERLGSEHVTGFPLVPTMLAMLIKTQNFSGAHFPHLRYFTNTAAALPPAHIAGLRERFPGTRIYSMYGLTECKRVAYLPPDQIDRRPTSVGKAIPNTEVYIVNAAGGRARVGEIGELVVRGAHVMCGYWERPEETARALRSGPLPGERVLHTGDLFKMDDEGFLYFVGRKDDIIKTRGEKVSPKEVEAVLYRMPEVLEAAVLGVPDAVLGEAIRAVIVPVAGATLTAQTVLRHCAQHLEDFMVPKSVEFRTALPKTTTGKIARREIQTGERALSLLESAP